MAQDRLLPDREETFNDDMLCDLEPDKICDNCMKCLFDGADFRAIAIEGIELGELNKDSEQST